MIEAAGTIINQERAQLLHDIAQGAQPDECSHMRLLERAGLLMRGWRMDGRIGLTLTQQGRWAHQRAAKAGMVPAIVKTGNMIIKGRK